MAATDECRGTRRNKAALMVQDFRTSLLELLKRARELCVSESASDATLEIVEGNNERPLSAIPGKVKSDLFDYVLEELDRGDTITGDVLYHFCGCKGFLMLMVYTPLFSRCLRDSTLCSVTCEISEDGYLYLRTAQVEKVDHVRQIVINLVHLGCWV
nr:hypothetical protein [Tanacetum cinerariifolium]